ncbi:hypothetical protein TVAG_340700 [Trichomonas vaginalis G3]|uniref:Uncharacterized protein n=1 Tax=Trichomonas vaginalis (strain ATCC PRA-98 / G3) TaxID=412133 RepID=A2DTM9_TRIV3|nr:WD40 repeat-containing protein [Trichomonas vaginalis G3]EAY16176.1 hypothetical protein TVAG_340700 [Trichomonas vaginalis G3]KAI5493333.1 WD40 repeat-containing protein [Trichomonas vaginalis G3]|eukprot:XP_001328399.1 hypothetical protein [Trichomonas vaginalis G3]
MRRAVRPTTTATANRRMQLSSTELVMPQSRSSSRSSLPVTENNKHPLFLQMWEAFESSSVELIENNANLFDNIDKLKILLSKSSTSFRTFFQTVARLYGNIFTLNKTRKQSLVTGYSSIRSSYTPFSTNWSNFTQYMEQQYVSIYRQVSAELNNHINPMISFLSQSINQFNDVTTNLVTLFSEIKKSFELIFQNQKFLHQGSQNFAEVLNNISIMLSAVEDIQLEQRNNLINTISYLFRTSYAFCMNYISFLTSKNQFQEILDEYVSRLDLQVDTSRSLPLSSIHEAKNEISSNEVKYLGGNTFDEIIESGKKVIGLNNPSNKLFFDDLQKISSEFRKIIKQNAKFREIFKFLFNKEYISDEEAVAFRETIKKSEYNENQIQNLEKQIQELKVQVETINNPPNSQNLPKNSENTKKYQDQNEESDGLMITQCNSVLNQLLFGDNQENYLDNFDFLSEKVISFRNDLVKISSSDNNTSFDRILVILKEKIEIFNNSEKNPNETQESGGNHNDPSKDKESSSEIQIQVKKDFSRLKNSIITMLKDAKKPITQNSSINDIIESLSQVFKSNETEYSQEYLNKTFSTVLSMVNVSSKVVPSMYLPEICYFFMLMFQSINYLNKFTSDMDEIFDKFEFNMPERDSEEFNHLKHCSSLLSKHLNEIEPSQMHSSVFHSVSRFIILIQSLVSHL